MNDKENFVILLEIFNKLIKFQAFSFLRQPLTRLVLDKPEFIVSYDKDVERDFVRALNTQEIIYSIISNKKMKFMRKFLKSYFPLKDMLKHIESSVQKLGELEDKYKDSNRNMDTEDYDELRDYQYFDLVNIYIQVYLNTKYSTTNKEDVANDFSSFISIHYTEMLNNFNFKSDFSDPSTFKKSTFRFLMIYMKAFIANLLQYLNFSVDHSTSPAILNNSTNKSYNQGITKTYSNTKLNLVQIDEIYSEILSKIENSDNGDLTGELDAIHESNDNQNTHFSKQEGTFKYFSSRSQHSSIYNKVWKSYINSIIKNKEGRELIDNEQKEFVDVIFNRITDPNSNSNTVDSYK